MMALARHTVGFVAAVIVAWAVVDFDRAGQPPIDLGLQIPFPRDGVPPGDTMSVRYGVVLKKSCPFIPERQLIDSAGLIATLAVDAPLPIERETTLVAITIPLATAPGRAIYRVTRTYSCPWLFGLMHRSVTVPFPDLPITILPVEK
jgi:hypothetical protein